MIRICRAEDGEIFQVNASLRDIERAGSLEFFLHQETGVDQEAILAYLSDGRRLRNDNIRELAGSQDQTIFVFNKYYLDFDLDEVLRELKVDAQFQPPIEESFDATPPYRPSQLTTSYLRTAHTHHEYIKHIRATLHYQYEAIRIASSSLDLNVLAITDAFEGIAGTARRELEKQGALLAGVEADLDILSKVKIYIEFMSPTVRRAIESGDKHRTLGDYVSNVKMKQVAETCARTHEELRSRFAQTEEAIFGLVAGTDVVRGTVSKTSLLDEAESCSRTSQELSQNISETAANLETPTNNADNILQVLKQLDTTLRGQVQQITDIKNAYTTQCIGVLRGISTLNNDLVQLPVALANLQASFRGKNSFSHIQRLHNMLYAYGATIIEIVRRKEFAQFFYQRAQSILEVMAKLSVSERKRRQVYRGDVHGQLPFETRGMDDPVPTIDFSPTGNLDAAYSLERSDVDALLKVLEDLERFSQSENDPIALLSIRESKAALEKLVNKMDSLESGFDRIAERSLLSASRLVSSRRRLTEADEQAYHDLAEQLREAQESKARQESTFQEENLALHGEIRRLKSTVQDVEERLSAEQERADRVERDLHHARVQVESEVMARRILEERHSELSGEVEGQQQAYARALSDATDQAKIAELLRQELAQVRAEFEDVKALEARNSAKVSTLLEDQAHNLRNLEQARLRGEDLEAQIQAARVESDDVTRALKEASKDKDRLLRAQASEHDRIIRDHIAEADGDRAVLEHQFHELKAIQDDTERQLKDVRAQAEVANADAVGLRAELQRVEHELREARHVERVLRDDLRAGRASQSDYEHRLETSSHLVAQVLDVAIAFRNSHVKALNSALAIASHPNPANRQSVSMTESAFLPAMRHGLVGQPDEPSPIDPSDPVSALELLRAFDHDHFLEILAKPASTIRKWQKQCKEYRERAKGKISFRNFAKGDLALFLPTRNSVSKPWAAFNVSFPHYFLQATNHLAEQLKTREWIVARITSITERVVDRKDPNSNPYGLGDGVKYYMLEVEDWTQPTQNKRRLSSKKIQPDKEVVEPTSLPLTPAVPPEVEVEDTFHVTRSPTSHLFPVRNRSNSSPTAVPSSLSRLLAQAPTDNSEAIMSIQPPSDSPPISSPPPTPPSNPTSPSNHVTSTPRHAVGVPSPLRPASRTSRSSSRFSVSRMPVLGPTTSGSREIVKAAPTTAITEQPISSSPSSVEGSYTQQNFTPSPEGSISEGMSNIISHRRRTTSYHIPRTSHLAATTMTNAETSGRKGSTAGTTLANLASSWGVSLGLKKKAELASLAAVVESDSRIGDIAEGTSETSATDLLKRIGYETNHRI